MAVGALIIGDTAASTTGASAAGASTIGVAVTGTTRGMADFTTTGAHHIIMVDMAMDTEVTDTRTTEVAEIPTISPAEALVEEPMPMQQEPITQE